MNFLTLHFVKLATRRTSHLQFHVDSLTLCVTNTMMKKWFENFKQKAWEFRWALFSGILVGTSYIPFPPWALLFCYVPLWLLVIKTESSKKVFWQAWWTQFILTLIGFHWIAYTAHEFGKMPWSLSLIALLLFCAFMHIYIALAPWLAVLLRRHFQLSTGSTLVTIALLHSLLERSWPAIFQWNLGYPLLWAKVPLYHWADVVGFEGLSSFVLLINAWLAWIWLKQDETKKALSHLGALVLLLALLIGTGALRGASWNNFDAEVRTTVIQANIGNHEKVAAEKGRGFQDEILERFLNMSREALAQFPQTDIFIWPETAYADYLDKHHPKRERIEKLTSSLREMGKSLITGAFSREERIPGKKERATFNGLFLINQQGENVGAPYRKTELLAFGEYLPLSESFPIILTWLPFVSNFGRGLGPEVIPWTGPMGNINWGGQICYEGLYPEFSRGLSEKQADILVNVTNDSWFGTTFEPSQHLYMTLARGIEVRRPLVRSTNTGISTAILANGQVLEKSPLHREWFGEFVIRYKTSAPETLFVRFGHRDWIIILLALFAIVTGSAYHARTRRP